MGKAHREGEGPLFETLIDRPLEHYNLPMKDNHFVALHLCLCIIWIATVISMIYWFSPVTR
jgi:hypothetical protein